MNPDRLTQLGAAIKHYAGGHRELVPPGLLPVLDGLAAPTGGAFPTAERIVESAGELSVAMALSDEKHGERAAVARAAVLHGIRVLSALVERGYGLAEIDRELDLLLAR